ncbi:DUF6153 family protein [Streptomyces nigrescens]
MRQQARHPVRPRGARAYVLLVLAVLAGVVAMHGLGPAAASAPPHAMPTAHHAVTAAAHGHTDAAGCDTCLHVDHDDGVGGHADHADSTCAASGTGAAPVLPAPALAPVGAITCATADAPVPVPAAALGARAPPSLSQLQLLRI